MEPWEKFIKALAEAWVEEDIKSGLFQGTLLDDSMEPPGGEDEKPAA